MASDAASVRAAILRGEYDDAVRERARALEVQEIDAQYRGLEEDVRDAIEGVERDLASTFGAPTPSRTSTPGKSRETRRD